MITDAILSLVTIVSGVFRSIMPELDLSFVDPLVAQFAGFIGAVVATIDPWVPVTEIFEVVQWGLLVFVPFVLIYSLGQWIWDHIPLI